MMTSRRSGRARRFNATTLTALVAVALLVFAACATEPDVNATADVGDAGPDPISVEMLTPRAEFTDDVAAQLSVVLDGRDATELDITDASHIAVAQITVQPEAWFPWHTHPGPVLVTIAEGDFVYILAEDCVERGYTTGEAFVDSGGGNTHTAYNPSTTDETVVIGVFLGSPGNPDEPLTVPVSPSEQEALNDECGL